MTKQEFIAWARHTERSKKGWQVDQVTLANTGRVLLYHGGEAGTYVEIAGDTIAVGTYEGAIPHIGEAIFKSTGRKTFTDANAAFTAVITSTGVRGLLAILGVQS